MHAHPGHSHEHGDRHHHFIAPRNDKRYSIAVALNLGFVAIEVAAGFVANSTALLSDAAHNLSDVLGLALAGAAAWLATRGASVRRTYGFSKATVLAALANALVLVAVSGGLLAEAGRRLFDPPAIEPMLVMAVAATGVIVNGATALIFMAGRERDVNARGAFLHMLADAGVSAAVIIAGFAISLTGFAWIDPLISIAVVLLILWGAWGLLRESLDLALDAAPTHIDTAAVRAFLSSQPGVIAVHDLHVWALSADKAALTAHLVRPQGSDDAFLAAIDAEMAQRFQIAHVTLQVERARRDDCAECR